MCWDKNNTIAMHARWKNCEPVGNGVSLEQMLAIVYECMVHKDSVVFSDRKVMHHLRCLHIHSVRDTLDATGTDSEERHRSIDAFQLVLPASMTTRKLQM